MQIERAGSRDFSELMELMVRSFRTVAPRHPRFERIFPDLYQPTDELMARHRIVRIGGKITASVGVYPIEMALGGVHLPIAGIGGVCTSPRHRCQGHMSALLAAVKEELRAEGWMLSWLTGARGRYARYGWETAGSAPQVHFLLPRSRGRGAERWETGRAVPGKGREWKQLVLAHEALVCRGCAGEAELVKRFSRLGVDIRAAENGSRFSYLAFNSKFRQLVEWGGDPEGVAFLLRRHTAGRKMWWAEIPPIRDAYSDLFFSMAESVGHRLSNLSIMDLPRLLEAYEPHLVTAWPKDLCIRLTIAHLDGRTDCVTICEGRVSSGGARPALVLEMDELKMVRLLFGPLKPSFMLGTRARPLDAVLPLPFFLPYLWWV